MSKTKRTETKAESPFRDLGTALLEHFGGEALTRSAKDVLVGKVAPDRALRDLATATSETVDRLLTRRERSREARKVTDTRLREVLRERAREERQGKVRRLERGKKTEYLLRGVIRDEDGEPVAGLVVEGVREGNTVAVDVTDGKGRYEFRLPAQEAERDEAPPEVAVRVSLEGRGPAAAGGEMIRLKRGKTLESDITLPAGKAVVRRLREQRCEVDAARLANLERSHLAAEVFGRQLNDVGEGLKTLLAGAIVALEPPTKDDSTSAE
jgi:hypothetical protein